MSKIRLNQSINYVSMEEKMQGLSKQKIPSHSLIIFKQLMIFIKIQKTIIQEKNRKVLLVFDDMTVDMETNKQMVPKVTELFLRGKKLNIFLVFI